MTLVSEEIETTTDNHSFPDGTYIHIVELDPSTGEPLVNTTSNPNNDPIVIKARIVPPSETVTYKGSFGKQTVFKSKVYPDEIGTDSNVVKTLRAEKPQVGDTFTINGGHYRLEECILPETLQVSEPIPVEP